MTSFSSFIQPLFQPGSQTLPPGFQLCQCPSTCVLFTIWNFLCIRFSLLKVPFFLLQLFTVHMNKHLNLHQIKLKYFNIYYNKLHTYDLSRIWTNYMDFSNTYSICFPGISVVKNPPAMQETPVQSLGQVYLLEKEMATQSSILAWKIPWTEDP